MLHSLLLVTLCAIDSVFVQWEAAGHSLLASR